MRMLVYMRCDRHSHAHTSTANSRHKKANERLVTANNYHIPLSSSLAESRNIHTQTHTHTPNRTPQEGACICDASGIDIDMRNAHQDTANTAKHREKRDEHHATANVNHKHTALVLFGRFVPRIFTRTHMCTHTQPCAPGGCRCTCDAAAISMHTLAEPIHATIASDWTAITVFP